MQKIPLCKPAMHTFAVLFEIPFSKLFCWKFEIWWGVIFFTQNCAIFMFIKFHLFISWLVIFNLIIFKITAFI